VWSRNIKNMRSIHIYIYIHTHTHDISSLRVNHNFRRPSSLWRPNCTKIGAADFSGGMQLPSCILAAVKAPCNFTFHVDANRNFKLAKIIKFMPLKFYILGRLHWVTSIVSGKEVHLVAVFTLIIWN